MLMVTEEEARLWWRSMQSLHAIESFSRAGARIEDSEDLSTHYQAEYISIRWETRATLMPHYELCRTCAAINGQLHCVLGRANRKVRTVWVLSIILSENCNEPGDQSGEALRAGTAVETGIGALRETACRPVLKNGFVAGL